MLESASKLTNLDDIKQLLAMEIRETDQLIMAELQSDVVLINQLGLHIINSGGKRLRPLLVLIAASALGYQGSHQATLAAVIEFIHTATLLHDDVVDASDLRRGQETANALFGNEASVLTGDFLYSRAFQLMVKVKSLPVMDVLADTTNLIAEGEVLQLMNCNDPDLTEQDYYEVIRRKTAILFATACELGAIIADQPDLRKPLFDYGLNLGMAFQVVDDMLDYVSSASEMGKNVGDDLAEGKPTLPLMRALQLADVDDSEMIRQAIINGDTRRLPEILSVIEATKAIEYCQHQAQGFTDKALEAIAGLPENEYLASLRVIAELALARQS